MPDNITDNTNENIIINPVIDSIGCCYDSITDTKIYNCTLSDNNDCITGYTEEGIKAKYIFDHHKWYYGHDISKLYLIPFNKLDPDKHKEYSIKGGTKTQEILHEKRTLNDIAKNMLSAVLTETQVNEILGDATNLIGEDRSAGAVMIAKMIQTACAGSFKAAEFVRDTAGYKPQQQVSIEADIMTDADRSLLEKIGRRIG